MGYLGGGVQEHCDRVLRRFAVCAGGLGRVGSHRQEHKLASAACDDEFACCCGTERRYGGPGKHVVLDRALLLDVGLDERPGGCSDPEHARLGSEGDVVPGPGALAVKPVLWVWEARVGLAETRRQNKVKRGELEHVQCLLVCVAANREIASVRAEDRRLVAVGLQNQCPAEDSHLAWIRLLIDSREESVRRALLAGERGHQAAGGMRRDPRAPGRIRPAVASPSCGARVDGGGVVAALVSGTRPGAGHFGELRPAVPAACAPAFREAGVGRGHRPVPV